MMLRILVILERLTSPLVNLEKFSLNFSTSWLVIRVNLLHLSRPNSLIVLTIIFWMFFYLIKLLSSGFVQFQGNFVGG